MVGSFARVFFLTRSVKLNKSPSPVLSPGHCQRERLYHVIFVLATFSATSGNTNRLGDSTRMRRRVMSGS
eukprot:6686400-Pyramimonas_sp.AAC.1